MLHCSLAEPWGLVRSAHGPIYPGGVADTRMALILLLRQLRQKVHFAVEHGAAQPARAAIARTPDRKRSDGERVARLLMLEDVDDGQELLHVGLRSRKSGRSATPKSSKGLGSRFAARGDWRVLYIRGKQLILQPSLDATTLS